MKAKAKILTLLVLVALFASLVTVVTAADPNTYTITRTSPTGSVQVGSTVTVTAQTTNSKVNTVVFTWYAPGDYPNGPVTYTSTDSTPNDGFTSTFVVNTLGQWNVNATFENIQTLNGGSIQKYIYSNPSELSLTVNANFFVLPEYPLIGTAGVGIAMLLALIVFRKTRESNYLKAD